MYPCIHECILQLTYNKADVSVHVERFLKSWKLLQYFDNLVFSYENFYTIPILGISNPVYVTQNYW